MDWYLNADKCYGRGGSNGSGDGRILKSNIFTIFMMKAFLLTYGTVESIFYF